MVDAYEARPAYPVELLDALAHKLAPGARILDVGAGIGHLAIPLSQRGFQVTAAEPALLMLQRLEQRAMALSLPIELCHAKAEALPFEAGSFDMVVLADALHFIDSERASTSLASVLGARGVVAVLIAEFAATPFMTQLRRIMEDAAPRRPRNVLQSVVELFAVSGLRLPEPRVFHDELPVTWEHLEQLLQSISFIGPAMNPARTAAFRSRVRAIPHEPCWARTFSLYLATKK
jgi:SAM-dependent methyltransferase